MSLAVIAKRELSADETSKVRDDLIESLQTVGRNEDAGDLLAEAKDNEEM